MKEMIRTKDGGLGFLKRKMMISSTHRPWVCSRKARSNIIQKLVKVILLRKYDCHIYVVELVQNME